MSCFYQPFSTLNFRILWLLLIFFTFKKECIYRNSNIRARLEIKIDERGVRPALQWRIHISSANRGCSSQIHFSNPCWRQEVFEMQPCEGLSSSSFKRFDSWRPASIWVAESEPEWLPPWLWVPQTPQQAVAMQRAKHIIR